MPYPVDVFFTGLMLICVSGQPNCPQGPHAAVQYPNTSWVVKANGIAEGPKRICGWYRGEETKLELKFNKGDFDQEVKGKSIYCQAGDVIICTLPIKYICVVRKGEPQPDIPEPRLESLPRLDEIDRRLVAPNERLKDPDYVPSVIHFPEGTITGGPIWPEGGKPTRWYRSDGSTDAALPRQLSDRLKVDYGKVETLTIKDCDNENESLTLTPKKDARLVFQNVTTYPPVPDYIPDGDGGHDYLTYLVWYYRLAEWDTQTGDCPDYAGTRKDPVLLRCVSKQGASCAYSSAPNADTRFWPPLVGPRPRENY